MPEDNQNSTVSVLLGFGLGLIGGALCFAITVVVGLTFQSRYRWVSASERNRADSCRGLSL